MPADHPHGHVPPHGRRDFPIEGEAPRPRAGTTAAAPEFRFSRMGPQGPTRLPQPLRRKVAEAMLGPTGHRGSIPAGYTYLGQFVDHDLTFDRTVVTLGDQVSPADLLQGRSPTLDLDSLYGAGPTDPVSAEFYADDRHLKMGKTVRTPPDAARVGFDLARIGTQEQGPNRRRALIPDRRNDENLAVAQHHLAMIRFHNRVVDTLDADVPASERFARARRLVVLHYQWMLKTDYLRRICDRAVVDDVFGAGGRKVFEVGADPLSMPTMPVEFSVAAFRLGHSMIRRNYDWNKRFPGTAGTLEFLFEFSGTSGFLAEGDRALPSNWIADFRRLYNFTSVGRPDLKPPPGAANRARGIDTVLADSLKFLPPGSFDGDDDSFGTLQANLAFRNLTRAAMVRLATGQQMVAHLRSKGVAVTKLTPRQIVEGDGGAVLSGLTAAERQRFVADTPLWFYVLREAELNGGRLSGVGARIVVETFHRAMEGSTFSIVRNTGWRPRLGEVTNRFTMADLLLFAFEGDERLLAPLGD